jgi:hypothetical protein
MTDKGLKNQRPFIISEKVRPEVASASGFSANATAAQYQTQSLLSMICPAKSNQTTMRTFARASSRMT